MGVLDTFRLDGKVAVVTGANRGLGYAFATALGEAGASLALIARDTAKTAEAVASLEARGMRVSAHRADVARREDVDAVVADVVSTHGRVDILVNNAGTCIHRPRIRRHRERMARGDGGQRHRGVERMPGVRAAHERERGRA